MLGQDTPHIRKGWGGEAGLVWLCLVPWAVRGRFWQDWQVDAHRDQAWETTRTPECTLGAPTPPSAETGLAGSLVIRSHMCPQRPQSQPHPDSTINRSASRPCTSGMPSLDSVPPAVWSLDTLLFFPQGEQHAVGAEPLWPLLRAAQCGCW